MYKNVLKLDIVLLCCFLLLIIMPFFGCIKVIGTPLVPNYLNEDGFVEYQGMQSLFTLSLVVIEIVLLLFKKPIIRAVEIALTTITTLFYILRLLISPAFEPIGGMYGCSYRFSVLGYITVSISGLTIILTVLSLIKLLRIKKNINEQYKQQSNA